ncbi:intermembrane phospholipid transport protein YdbH family protein [Aurantiacibacter gilvus]|uniref:YdbH domain-containing protein n=1 Tax=Aurantiacibacter gilvus TaxID=3139141 RepID=A0ABU9IF62_9SPHN
MAQPADEDLSARPKGRTRRLLRNALRVVILMLLAALALAWFQRERLADDLITSTLADLDVAASYEIESIGPREQVLTNVVVGDPDRPDLTIERVEVSITPRFGVPDVTSVRLTQPRLFGTWRDGELSFGALDPLIFTEAEGPFEFPSMVLTIDDGRALLQTDHGDVGAKLSGGGHLRGGFAGELAMIAPRLELGNCVGEQVTLFGAVSIDAERPEFHGPLRFASLDCANGLFVRDAGVALDLQAERNLVEYEGDIDFATERVLFAEVQTALAGEGQFTWHDNEFNLLFDVAARDAQTPYAMLGELAINGRLRALEAGEQVELEGDLTGDGLLLGPEIDALLASAELGGEGTLIEPLVAKLRRNLGPQMRGSTLEASFTARQLGERSSLVIPQASLRGGNGATLLSLSRAQLVMGQAGLPRFSGNFVTGGEGLPQLSGRMEQADNGALQMRLAMREYAAGDARLALPELAIVQGSGGRLALDGRATASGPLPGGSVSELQLPIDASIAADGSLAMWRGCRELRFDRLAAANLALGRQSLTLCPRDGQPILRYDSAGLRFAAATDALNLTGELADTPITLASGPVGIAYPGTMTVRDLGVTLGEGEGAQRFAVRNLRADLSADAVGGDFAGADVFLAAVPLDLMDAAGNWSYADDRLVIDNASFDLVDRQAVNRFEPLIARGATLALADSIVTANALLRHPYSDTVLSRVDIVHDLTSGIGHADLAVDGISFGPDLQPAPPASHCLRGDLAARVPQTGLSCLALGVASDFSGTITGGGRIDWNADAVTSSGTFTSDGLDLAAPFGPVQGARGTIHFTDLLGLSTAPDQRLDLASINPGVEVQSGEIGLTLTDGETLELTGGQWPFMGGTLRMDPVVMNIGVAESRTYVLHIEGLEAARFIEHMEMGNLAATGTFDGSIPIVFDADGNGQLVGGELVSRPPGGNVAYVGELTYEDMGFFANYAFRTLRDLRYDRMEIVMNGPLAGELVTQVRFEGIGQGDTAERNFVSRAIGDLPIELRINVRAPFYRLLTSFRSLYDPSAVRDPRNLGLMSSEGGRLREAIDQDTVDEQEAAAEAEAERRLREAFAPDEPTIQPQESEPEP